MESLTLWLANKCMKARKEALDRNGDQKACFMLVEEPQEYRAYHGYPGIGIHSSYKYCSPYEWASSFESTGSWLRREDDWQYVAYFTLFGSFIDNFDEAVPWELTTDPEQAYTAERFFWNLLRWKLAQSNVFNPTSSLTGVLARLWLRAGKHFMKRPAKARGTKAKLEDSLSEKDAQPEEWFATIIKRRFRKTDSDVSKMQFLDWCEDEEYPPGLGLILYVAAEVLEHDWPLGLRLFREDETAASELRDKVEKYEASVVEEMSFFLQDKYVPCLEGSDVGELRKSAVDLRFEDDD